MTSAELLINYPLVLTFSMAQILNLSLGQFTFNFIKINLKCNRVIESRKTFARPFQCVLIEDTKRVEVKNGKDSLDICRVVNGMWQTSGGWGRIDRDGAIYAMLQFADAGLNTFDFADICKAHDNI